MRRVERECCAKGRHTRWRAWAARYTGGLMTITCDYCGRQLQSSEIVGSGPPKRMSQADLMRMDRIVTLKLNRIYKYRGVDSVGNGGMK